MKTIMIDMDDVITHGRILDYINEFLNTDYKLEEQTDFYLQNITGNRKDEFYEYIKDKNLYENASLKEDAYEVIEKLNNKYELYIVTAYSWINKGLDFSSKNLANKYNFLKEKLPFIKTYQYIFTENKNILNFDIKIDDRLNNLKNCNENYLFTNWHNKNINNEYLKENNIIRVNSWKEIENILLKK